MFAVFFFDVQSNHYLQILNGLNPTMQKLSFVFGVIGIHKIVSKTDFKPIS